MFFTSQARNVRKKKTFQPRLELLEDRLVPTVHTWTGGAFNNNWTNNNNWDVGAPNSNDGFDILVFPANAARKTADNNFATDTISANIIIEGSGYELIGNRAAIFEITTAPKTTNTIRFDIKGVGNLPDVKVGDGALLEITGRIDVGGIDKRDTGQLVLSANNNYAGITLVIDGKLLVNGNQPNSETHVGPNGILGGVGKIGSLEADGAVDPGTGAPGILHVAGDLRFENDAEFRVFLNGPVAGSGHDQLDVQGEVELRERSLLGVSVGSGAKVGNTFRIINNSGFDSVIGTFSGLPEGTEFITKTGQKMRITYTGGTIAQNNVVLTYVNTGTMAPELAVTPSIINEGDTVTVTGRLHDPDVNDKLTLIVNWNDGSREERFHPGLAPFELRHRYRDNGDYRPRFTWLDDHGLGNNRELFVSVNNVAPQVTLAGPNLSANGHLKAHGAVHDPGADRWTATVDYGDGSGVRRLDLHGNQTFQLDHRYRAAGDYRVTVAVQDDDGGVGVHTMFVSTSGGLVLDAAHPFEVDLNCKNAGHGYDQLQV